MYYFFYSWIIFKCPDDISILIGCMRDWWKNILSFLFLRYQINKYKVRKLSRLYIIMLHYLLCIWVNLFIFSHLLYGNSYRRYVQHIIKNVVMDFACNLLLNRIHFYLWTQKENEPWKSVSRNCIEHDFSNIFLKLKRYCEKATKFKKSHTILKLLSDVKTKWEIFFKFLRPSQNIWILTNIRFPISMKHTLLCILHALLFSYCFEPKPFLISRKKIAAWE